MTKPEYYTDEHRDYLDALKDSNAINMMGARPYVEEEFGLNRVQASQVLKYWMFELRERRA